MLKTLLRKLAYNAYTDELVAKDREIRQLNHRVRKAEVRAAANADAFEELAEAHDELLTAIRNNTATLHSLFPGVTTDGAPIT